MDEARERMDYLPFRTDEFIDFRNKGVNGGRTCYFGTRGGNGTGKYVRFYEKGRDAGLGIDRLRYEAELSDDYGQDAAEKLVEAGDAWDEVAKGILAGMIDFREGYGEIRGTAHAARDTERYAWWQSLLDRLACGVKLKAKKKQEPSLLRLEQWARDAWPRALALLREWKGDTSFRAFLGELLQLGKTKLTERDLALVGIAKSGE